MVEQHLNCLNTAEAKEFITIPKSSDEKLRWKAANNKNYVSTQFVPIDERDILIKGTLAGAVVQIDYKRPKRIKQEKTVITLFKQKKGVKLRAYQVEAADENNQTSRHAGVDIYGCHEHVGSDLNKISPLYEIDNITSWFNYFCDRVNLNFTGQLPSSPLVDNLYED